MARRVQVENKAWKAVAVLEKGTGDHSAIPGLMDAQKGLRRDFNNLKRTLERMRIVLDTISSHLVFQHMGEHRDHDKAAIIGDKNKEGTHHMAEGIHRMPYDTGADTGPDTGRRRRTRSPSLESNNTDHWSLNTNIEYDLSKSEADYDPSAMLDEAFRALQAGVDGAQIQEADQNYAQEGNQNPSQEDNQNHLEDGEIHGEQPNSEPSIVSFQAKNKWRQNVIEGEQELEQVVVPQEYYRAGEHFAEDAGVTGEGAIPKRKGAEPFNLHNTLVKAGIITPDVLALFSTYWRDFAESSAAIDQAFVSLFFPEEPQGESKFDESKFDSKSGGYNRTGADPQNQLMLRGLKTLSSRLLPYRLITPFKRLKADKLRKETLDGIELCPMEDVIPIVQQILETSPNDLPAVASLVHVILSKITNDYFHMRLSFQEQHDTLVDIEKNQQATRKAMQENQYWKLELAEIEREVQLLQEQNFQLRDAHALAIEEIHNAHTAPVGVIAETTLSEKHKFVLDAAARMIQRRFRQKLQWRHLKNQIYSLVDKAEDEVEMPKSLALGSRASRMTGTRVSEVSQGSTRSSDEVVLPRVRRTLDRIGFRLKQMQLPDLSSSFRVADVHYAREMPVGQWFTFLEEDADILFAPTELRLLLNLFMGFGGSNRKRKSLIQKDDAPKRNQRAMEYIISIDHVEELAYAIYGMPENPNDTAERSNSKVKGLRRISQSNTPPTLNGPLNGPSDTQARSFLALPYEKAQAVGERASNAVKKLLVDTGFRGDWSTILENCRTIHDEDDNTSSHALSEDFARNLLSQLKIAALPVTVHAAVRHWSRIHRWSKTGSTDVPIWYVKEVNRFNFSATQILPQNGNLSCSFPGNSFPNPPEGLTLWYEGSSERSETSKLEIPVCTIAGQPTNKSFEMVIKPKKASRLWANLTSHVKKLRVRYVAGATAGIFTIDHTKITAVSKSNIRVADQVCLKEAEAWGRMGTVAHVYGDQVEVEWDGESQSAMVPKENLILERFVEAERSFTVEFPCALFSAPAWVSLQPFFEDDRDAVATKKGERKEIEREMRKKRLKKSKQPFFPTSRVVEMSNYRLMVTRNEANAINLTIRDVVAQEVEDRHSSNGRKKTAQGASGRKVKKPIEAIKENIEDARHTMTGRKTTSPFRDKTVTEGGANSGFCTNTVYPSAQDPDWAIVPLPARSTRVVHSYEIKDENEREKEIEEYLNGNRAVRRKRGVPHRTDDDGMGGDFAIQVLQDKKRGCCTLRFDFGILEETLGQDNNGGQEGYRGDETLERKIQTTEHYVAQKQEKVFFPRTEMRHTSNEEIDPEEFRQPFVNKSWKADPLLLKVTKLHTDSFTFKLDIMDIERLSNRLLTLPNISHLIKNDSWWYVEDSSGTSNGSTNDILTMTKESSTEVKTRLYLTIHFSTCWEKPVIDVGKLPSLGQG